MIQEEEKAAFETKVIRVAKEKARSMELHFLGLEQYADAIKWRDAQANLKVNVRWSSLANKFEVEVDFFPTKNFNTA